MKQFTAIKDAMRHKPLQVTAAVAALWSLLNIDWLWLRPGAGGWLTGALQWLVFTAGLGLAVAWTCWAHSESRSTPVSRSTVYTAGFVVAWQFVVFASDALAWHVMATQSARLPHY